MLLRKGRRKLGPEAPVEEIPTKDEVFSAMRDAVVRMQTTEAETRQLIQRRKERLEHELGLEGT